MSNDFGIFIGWICDDGLALNKQIKRLLENRLDLSKRVGFETPRCFEAAETNCKNELVLINQLRLLNEAMLIMVSSGEHDFDSKRAEIMILLEKAGLYGRLKNRKKKRRKKHR